MTEGTDASDVSLGAETVKATAAKFSMAAIGFVGTIIFARMLGPERFGAYYMLFALVKIADLPIEGWATAAKKRFSEEGAKTGEVAGGQFVFTLIWISIGSVGAFVAAGYLTSYTEIASAAPLAIALLCSEALFVSSERLLQARGLIGIATWTDALRSYVTFGLQLTLVLAGWGVAGMAYGLSAASLLVTPITLYYVGVRPRLPSLGTLTSQWEYARYSLLSTLFGRVYERFDILLLGYLLGPTAAGWYEVAYKLVTPANFITEAASNGLMARVSYLNSQSENVSNELSNVLSFTGIFAIPIFFGSLVTAKPLIVTAYGIDYVPAAPLLVVIALYHTVSSQNIPLGRTVAGLDKPRLLVYTSAIGVAINGSIGYLLVMSIGPVGAALSSLAAEVADYVLLSYVLGEFEERFRLITSSFVKQVFSGVIMIILISIMFFSSIQSGIKSTGVVIVIGGVTYFSVLLFISEELRYTARSLLDDIS